MAHYTGTNSDRAMQLTKQRLKEQEEAEHQKAKIREAMKFEINDKFSTFSELPETSYSKSFGLFTLNEMKAKQQENEKALKLTKTKNKNDDELKEKSRKKSNQQKQVAKLSFDLETEECDDVCHNERSVKKIKKNPDVDTSFLYDRNRNEHENKIREEIKKQWLDEQKRIKNETINVVFSYYDGSGHRFNVTMKKGNTISEFLQVCLDNILRKEFPELKKVTNDQLMYIKEDLILPYHYTFYDFIVQKARGKSGPLFNFDVKDDVRVISDARIEKEDSHAGKIVVRGWYLRNRHIFPASRWEPYDPSKKYEVYTIKDTKKSC